MQYSTTVTVGASAESKAVEVPKLTPQPNPAASSAPSTTPSTSATVVAPPTTGPVLTDRPPSKVPAIVALTTGSVLVLGGLATYVFGVRSARDDYFDTCIKQITPNCENDADRSRVRLLEGVSYGAIALGLVGVGAGVFLLSRSEQRSVTVAVPAGGGLVAWIGGRF